MKIIITIAVLLSSCSRSSVMEVKKNDTIFLAKEFVPVHDTLVILLTYDSVPHPYKNQTGPYLLNGGWTMGKMEMFKDGKTIDTIRKHGIIYY